MGPDAPVGAHHRAAGRGLQARAARRRSRHSTASRPRRSEMKKALLRRRRRRDRASCSTGRGKTRSSSTRASRTATSTSSTRSRAARARSAARCRARAAAATSSSLTRFDRKHRVAAVLEKHGGQVVPFQFERRGLTTWSFGHGAARRRGPRAQSLTCASRCVGPLRSVARRARTVPGAARRGADAATPTCAA